MSSPSFPEIFLSFFGENTDFKFWFSTFRDESLESGVRVYQGCTAKTPLGEKFLRGNKDCLPEEESGWIYYIKENCDVILQGDSYAGESGLNVANKQLQKCFPTIPHNMFPVLHSVQDLNQELTKDILILEQIQ